MIKAGINGFNRIGRLFFRRSMRKEVEVVAINDARLKPEYVAYLLKHDSTYGRLNVQICGDQNSLKVNGKKVSIYSEKDPSRIRWGEANVDYVVETSGELTTTEQVSKHLEGGAKKIIIAAPSADAPMFVSGVNLDKYQSEMTVISSASCTVTALAPLIKVIHDNFYIEEALITDIHALSATQYVLDGIGDNWRSCRSGIQNIIPFNTHMPQILGKIIPELMGKLTGMAFSVPVPNVSLVDLTVHTKNSANSDFLNEKIKEASNGCFKGILGYTDDEVVSSDFKGHSTSAVYDAQASVSLNDKFHKLVIWYDNEYGFCCRILDLLKYVKKTDEEAAKCKDENNNDKDGNQEKDKALN